MKILLAAVNAKYIHSCPAVYSLLASCGHPELVEIAEFTINDRYQDILDGILERGADAVGFSTYIWNTDIVRDLAEDLRRVLGRKIILFAGGPEASYSPEKFLDSCDFVICREGEKPFKMFCDLAAGITDVSEESLADLVKTVKGHVPGAAYLDGSVNECRSRTVCPTGNRVAMNPPEPGTARDIDSIPFLYDNLDLFDNRIIYYESSRGCPFRCTYCLSSIDRHVRYRNIDTVLKELQYFIDREVPQVKFIDRTFNSSHIRTLRIWSYLKEHDNGKTNFHFEIGADLLNEEELTLLESLRPGLVQLEIGIQSTNPSTLEAIRRITDLPKLYANIRRLRRAQNINLHVDLIAGLPYEDYERFAGSFEDVYSLHADQLQLGFLKVLGGTDMQAKAAEYDLIYSVRPPYEVLRTKWISAPELDRLRRICDVLEYYYNSRQFIHTLDYLENYWESAFAFYEKLADFFREKGYDKARPSAARRYEVLEEYVTVSGICIKNAEQSELKTACSNAGEYPKCRFDPAVFREYLRFDKALHIHKSRRQTVSDEYNFGNGKVRITVFYGQKNVLTGEALYHIQTNQSEEL